MHLLNHIIAFGLNPLTVYSNYIAAHSVELDSDDSDLDPERENMQALAEQLVKHRVAAFTMRYAVKIVKTVFASDSDAGDPTPELSVSLDKLTKFAGIIEKEQLRVAALDTKHSTATTCTI